MFRLPNRVLIIGNARGIGPSIAETLLSEDRTVIIAVSDQDETSLMQYLQLGEKHGQKDAIAHSIDFGKKSAFDKFVAAYISPRISSLDAMIFAVEDCALERDLEQIQEPIVNSAIQSRAWPIVGFLQALKNNLGTYPRYAIGGYWYSEESSQFDHAYRNISSAVLETLCRYIASHLRLEGVLANLAGFRLTQDNDHFSIDPNNAARSILALCSGRFDALSGQNLRFDSGHALQASKSNH